VEGNTEQVEKTLADLRARVAALDEELARMNEMHTERTALQAAIQSLEYLIQQSPKDSVQMPIWQHAEQLLLGRGNVPMTAGEIALLLIGGGIKVEAQKPEESVRTTLIRKPDIFERVEGGKFRLKHSSSVQGASVRATDRPPALPNTLGNALTMRTPTRSAGANLKSLAALRSTDAKKEGH
jgi:hypothetical protein